jgi:hypothetical protein
MLAFAVLTDAFLCCLGWQTRPFGHVLKVIRENLIRAEAVGCGTVFHRTLPRLDEALEFGAPSALCNRSIVRDFAGMRPGLEWRRF